jgi:hypothetical protein
MQATLPFTTEDRATIVGRRLDPAKALKHKVMAGFILICGIPFLTFVKFEHAEWVGFAFLTAAAFMFHRGRRYGLVDAFGLMKQDSRDPILYIRSFADEYKLNQIASRQTGILPSIFHPSVEEQLSVVMAEIGPFIALGSPTEKLPEIGAARAYVTDEEWRKTIEQWMMKARLVLVGLGHTDAFWWEVELAANIVESRKLSFLIPPEKADYQVFKDRLEQILGQQLPPAKKFGCTRLSIYYSDESSGWQISSVRLPHYSRNFWSFVPFYWLFAPRFPLVYTFKRLFAPHMRSLRLTWGKRTLSPIMLPCIVTAAFAILLFVLTSK